MRGGGQWERAMQRARVKTLIINVDNHKSSPGFCEHNKVTEVLVPYTISHWTTPTCCILYITLRFTKYVFFSLINRFSNHSNIKNSQSDDAFSKGAHSGLTFLYMAYGLSVVYV